MILSFNVIKKFRQKYKMFFQWQLPAAQKIWFKTFISDDNQANTDLNFLAIKHL